MLDIKLIREDPAAVERALQPAAIVAGQGQAVMEIETYLRLMNDRMREWEDEVLLGLVVA